MRRDAILTGSICRKKGEYTMDGGFETG